MDVTPVALARAPFRRLVGHARQPLRLAFPLAPHHAGHGFRVHRGGHRRRPALVGEHRDGDLDALAAAADRQDVAHVHRLGRLAAGAIDLDLAAVDGLLGQRAGLEEARRPQPLVGAHRVGDCLRH
jgi:hypothetical protein